MNHYDPAFPVAGQFGIYQEGMSLRDYFAGQALMGMMASDAGWATPQAEVARGAYKLADAMLAERERR